MPHNRHRGTAIQGVCSHIDILPTILELLDLSPLHHLQGYSLANIIKSEDEEWQGTWALSDFYKQGNYGSSLVRDKYKIMNVKARKDERTLLYDLEKDPYEKKPRTKELQALADKMKNEMDSKLEEFAKESWDVSTREFSEKEKKTLKALGYIQ